MSRDRRDWRARRPSPFAPPRKRLGQHFLERAWVAKLVDAARRGSIALACYLSPETVFGDAAWLPLPRLASLLLAAALLSDTPVSASRIRAPVGAL